MAKPSIFQQFMRSLRAHWKTTLPSIKPLTERHGALAKASSFDAGDISTGQHVYITFQTSWKEAGWFTINLIIADEGADLSTKSAFQFNWEPGQRLIHGSHRIGHFLSGPQDKKHDKWWHLCEVEPREVGDGLDDYFQDLRHRLREGNWTAPSYENDAKVIELAIVDVTRDVETALKKIGIPLKSLTPSSKTTA